jgi:DNA polymerase I
MLKSLRVSLSQLRLSDLAVGSDGRNRTLLSPFRAKTGRNQPSNSRFIFGPSTWLRGLIKPEPGRAVAYADWSQQEFGIAASLSGDRAMMEAYLSGDPHLAFGQQAGQVPPDGTKKTHAADRELFKACVLGVQYGMGPEALAQRIGKPTAYGCDLLRLHWETYPAFWRWSDRAEFRAMLLNRLHTVFGWTVQLGPDANPRSLRNFPCQANGAEMMRLACCLVTETGVNIVAPVHDALMVEGPADAIEEIVARTQEAMAEASAVVLDGFRLRSDTSIVRWPDRGVGRCRVRFLGVGGSRPPGSPGGLSKLRPSIGSWRVGTGRLILSWRLMIGPSSASPDSRPPGAWVSWSGPSWSP